MKETIKNTLFHLALVVALGFVFVIPSLAQSGVNLPLSSLKLERLNYKPERVVPCYENGIEFFVPVSCEYRAPILKDRFDCKGNKLSDPKVVGWNTETCSKIERVFISDDGLRDRGYAPIPVVDPPNSQLPTKNDSGDGWWPWILLLALIAGVVYLISKWLNGKYNMNEYTTNWDEETKILDEVMKSMKANGISGIDATFPDGLKISMKNGEETNKKTAPAKRKKPEQPDTSVHKMD